MTIVTDLGNGWVRTEKERTEQPIGDECRACNPDCQGDCEPCVRESLIATEER